MGIAEGMLPRLKFYCDRSRHLVCVPYSIEGLHAMALELGIARCWFHEDHYDIPKKRIVVDFPHIRIAIGIRSQSFFRGFPRL